MGERRPDDTRAVLEKLRELLAKAPAGLATDFDGTISEIVSPPEAAVPLPGAREALGALAGRLGLLAVVSGRPVLDLAPRVGVPEAVYIGNHGAEWWRAGADPEPLHVAAPTPDETVRLGAANGYLADVLRALPGTRLEDKG